VNTVVEEREVRPSSQASPKDEKRREPAPRAARMQKDPAQMAPGMVRVAQSPVDGHRSCLDLAAEFLARG
jgi:hypothetical protein